MYYILFFLVSFLACVIGRLCGLGGGVIIKPVLDAFGIMSVSAVSFTSSCTVLMMTLWSVGAAVKKKEVSMNMKISTPLALGSAAGGISGKALYSMLTRALPNADRIGVFQAVLMLIMLGMSLVFTLNRSKFKTYGITKIWVCVLVGFVLGNVSAFLGGGSGPLNMVVLAFAFSMSTKLAVINSLYIILFSQIASLAQTLISGNIPPFSVVTVAGMAVFAIIGSEVGRKINRRLSEQQINKLFVILMLVLVAVNVYNIFRYI